MNPAERIAPHVRRTPAVRVAGASLGAPHLDSLHLKLELLQHTGSFKARGATNFVLSNRIGPAGVTAASGGNHGAAVAWAAREHGHRSTIFVPEISTPAKVDRLRSYGATVHQVGAVYSDSQLECERFQAESGATAIHPYDHPDVLAGAGTTGVEFVEQVDGLDTMLIATGGGGLAGGIAAALGPTVKLVVCETEQTAGYAAACAAGHPVDITVGGLAADALGAPRIGELPWSALSSVETVSAVVSDDELAAGQRHLWEEFRIVVEPSAAAAAAVLHCGRYVPEPRERVGVLLCGANTQLEIAAIPRATRD